MKTEIVAYLQCDVRYNKWLLKNCGNENVLRRTLSKVKEITNKLYASVYLCTENVEMIRILREEGVNVLESHIDDVNKRFIEFVETMDNGYVVRVGGDQVLLETDLTKFIINEMDKNGYEWYYDGNYSSFLPDIVGVRLVKKESDALRVVDRYFKAMEQMDVKRFRLKYKPMCFNCFRCNSDFGFRIVEYLIKSNKSIFDITEKILMDIQNNRYCIETGLLESWLTEGNEFFYDKDNMINPWITRSSIDFLEPRLNKEMRVFEWGAGNSTLFWMNHVKEVVSVEHNLQWCRLIKDSCGSNVKIRHIPLVYGGDYCKAALREKDKFQIVCIDGRDRVNCSKNVIDALSEDGVIIWDNSDRLYYNEGLEYLARKGFKRIDFVGMFYGSVALANTTSFFYRDNNVFCI